MKYENSFEIKSLEFLKNQLTRLHFKNIKKLAFFDKNSPPISIRSIDNYINFFEQLEELDFRFYINWQTINSTS